MSGQWQFPNCLAHSHCCCFKVRDLEAAGALITMSADTGVACIAQLLPGLFCKAFHLPEQSLSLRLLLLTLIVGHKLCKSLASQHPKEKSLVPLLHMGVSSALAVWQLIGLLIYVPGSIWDSLGTMFNSPVCSIVAVEKECEGVDVALHEMVQWAQGYFILMEILEVFCNPNDSVILFRWWAIMHSKQNQTIISLLPNPKLTSGHCFYILRLTVHDTEFSVWKSFLSEMNPAKQLWQPWEKK